MITPSFAPTTTERVLPKLALDFTTASLDPRVTFTRTTGASNPATYVASNGYITSATNNQPRFDHDPVTGESKGLLIEEQRTNLFQRSEEFDNAYWTKSNSTVTPNTVVAPDGTLTGDLITSTSTIGYYAYRIGVAGTMTLSMYMKAATSTIGGLYSYAGGNSAALFDLSNGTIKETINCSATISPSGNGWYRCSINYTTISGNGNCGFYVGSPSIGSSVYVWGAQLEAGSFPTSYIPTTTTALTRNADVATMTGTNFSDWYSASAGGVVVRVLPSTVSGTRPVLQFDDATANEVIVVRGSTTNPELVIVDGGSPQAQIDAGTIAANTAYNLGAAWNTDNCAAAVNGGAAVTDTSATIPTVTQARIGSDGTNYANAWLQKINYWPQRITNNETQAFSK